MAPDVGAKLIRRALIALAASAALAATAAAGLWLALRPPSLEVPRRGAFALANVTVVEPGVGRCRGCTLVAREGRIESVSPPSGQPPPAPSLPFAGSTVLPGLIDLHVHHPSAFAMGERQLFGLLFLAHGVTSVRDVGSFFGSVAGLRERIRRGEQAGPRTYLCGPLLDGDPPVWPGSRVVRDAAEAEAAVAEQVAAGADCVKVYNGVSLPALAGIARAARRIGLPVVAHVPSAASLADMGGLEVQHLMGVTDDWRRLGEGEIDFAVRTSASLAIRHTPTISTFEFGSRVGTNAAALDSAADLLPRYYRALLWSPDANPDLYDWLPGAPAALGTRAGHMREVVRRLHEAGVPIQVGTDTLNPFVVPGAAVHEELRQLVAAGFSPEEAWLAASRRAGEALAEPGLGTLEPGAPADFLIFGEDPTRDLAALDSLRAVVVDGRLYSREVLDEALARQREHFSGAVYDAVSMTLVRWSLPWLAAR